MRAEHLEEARKINEAFANRTQQLAHLGTSTELVVRSSGANGFHVTGDGQVARDMRGIVRRYLEGELAALRRRAAQIGLALPTNQGK